MSEKVILKFGEKEFELPVIIGSESEKAIDISSLKAKTGYITLDPGYKNTGSCASSITFLEGEEGVLRYRGYPIEEVAEQASFLDIVFLLIFGELPTKAQLDKFYADIVKESKVSNTIKGILEVLPKNSHPMGTMAALTNALIAVNPDITQSDTEEDIYRAMVKLLAKFPVLVGYTFRHKMGSGYVEFDPNLSYTDNIISMMFKKEGEKYESDPVMVDSFNRLLILHADHEQNCSTSTVRMAGSSRASLFTAIGAGISALWGPLHGGANQEVIEMLENIAKDGNPDKYIEMAKDKNSSFRLMGFGHRVYRNFDPRARVIKKATDEILSKLGVDDPVLQIARRLEAQALKDDYFISRRLYPNVDFYSGIIYRALGIPVDMFTVMFALGRLPGWIAQWREMRNNNEPIGRPRQVYIGSTLRHYTKIEDRG